jgi:hypothetical protein
MLQLPNTGIRYSTQKHNSDLGAFCDWVEASVLFAQARITRSDIVDVLLDEEVYVDSDFASEFVELGVGVISQRVAWTGSAASLDVEEGALRRTRDWQDMPAHGFCLALALRPRYPEWSANLGADYGAQGDLFERLTLEALIAMGWEVHRIGWSALGTDQSFKEAVEWIADRLNEKSIGGEIASEVKDGGVDLVCLRRFPDNLGGHPFFLVQCGSGDNWASKLGKPPLEAWRDLIRFTIPPMRAFATPFAFAEPDTFRSKRLQTEGMLLDRYRLLTAGRASENWLSAELKDDLKSWLGAAVASLPKLEE